MTVRRTRRHAPPADMRPLQTWDVVILGVGLVLSVVAGVIAYQVGGPYGERLEVDRRIQRVFNEDTGKLELLVYDIDGDLRFDTRSYMDGERVLRIEYDDNRDGRVDIWEFFRADQTTERLDEDTDGDGRPDRRTLFDGNGAITAELSLNDDPDHVGDGLNNSVSADLENKP